ncbi:hypothetical protein N6L24_08830 [Cognatishimia sp. SS12]|uniref:hypothetical protein n=1 Tax=Cognatishimia sp. SS12 TaxID=2979465 RepID=UPI00232E4C20|nr:hypothetical protein [Cognatishimia sp. SS12]MDC0738384.1 hypothetical protein [Cognatishimia sp. SS12]
MAEDLATSAEDTQAGCVYTLDPGTLFLDAKEAAEIGARYAADYQSGTPYHYI